MKIDQLERRLQSLIEVHLLNYLPFKKEDGLVAQQLAAEIENNIKEFGDTTNLPNLYTISGHPDLIWEWQDDSRLIEKLERVINIISTESALKFAEPLNFSLSPDPELGVDEVKIFASHSENVIAATQGMNSQKTEKDADLSTEEVPKNAFLIIHGTKIFPLYKTVVNIGRRIENDLILDDPRVSRDHAQLRVINGSFVIFDLNSTGGTYVNSQRTHQSTLYAGDVISLSGVPLIFGQDIPPRRTDQDKTEPLAGPYNSRHTVFMHDKTIDDYDKKR
ncbi:MAG: FHA domain-containing protein [Anaerolineales bacterium]|uniref:FHA domain-containing protein n=1 Tax=Candidatus Desulfolinea nitratireducens TaxID=2841698 RepID=A0A8J6NLE4_9CHLR|nr:FHA domain-containing protein [Candidatus Desulfolinea nitratireducens]MBL6959720.1 FHA domain-containing protein [Anaerolineales bacterium]